MILLSITSFYLPPERGREVLVLTTIATAMTVVILLILRSGRVQAGLNFFAVFTAAIAIIGF